MVWLAASASTAVVGYLLYRYLIVPASELETYTVTNSGVTEKNVCDDTPSFTFEEPAPEPPVPEPSKPQVDEKPIPSNGHISKKPDPKRHHESSPKTTLATPSMAPPSIRPKSPPQLNPPTFSGMPAPPPRPGGSALRPPPSAASSLRVPATKVLSNTSMAPTSSIMPQTGKPSRKVILQPCHSPLDWAMLTNNPHSRLRGNDLPDHLIRVTPSQLKYYNGRKGRDAWSVYQGKVYNISPYLPFHPGGQGELMRGAGKDAGQLFMEVHPWVNWDNMLSECLVGILVGEGEGGSGDGKSGGLDEMD